MPRTTEKMKALNIKIGLNMKTLRISRGITRKALGEQVGVELQQIEKYEHGTNGISLSRAMIIAEILGKDLNYFAEEKNVIPIESVELCLTTMRSFANIEDSKIKKTISKLIRVLAEKKETET